LGLGRVKNAAWRITAKLAPEDGVIQGFAAGDPRDGSIFALFVDPAHEGRGIGRALLALACGTLRAAGFATATLSTEPGTRAERFYRTNG
jgi:ribosomal protein S18 acetylase RimI-like enzyme